MTPVLLLFLAAARIGSQATLIETGETIESNAGERFPMQSVYKFPIAMAVLNDVDRGKLRLQQRIKVDKSEYVRAGQASPIRDTHPDGAELTIRELLGFAVSESDGSASDVLMRLVGGPKGVMSYLRSLGLNDIMVSNTEKEIGAANDVQYRNWATPRGMAALLQAFEQGKGVAPSSRILLRDLMIKSSTGPNRLKGGLPKGVVVAHKTGSSGTVDGITAATNDVGLITLPDGRRIAIAVFVSDSPDDLATREKAIADFARSAWDHWQ